MFSIISKVWQRRVMAYFRNRRGYGRCERCSRAWNWVEGHMTNDTDWSGCFPLCEDCWTELTPYERLPFYMSLVDLWVAQNIGNRDELEERRRTIRRAVLDGK